MNNKSAAFVATDAANVHEAHPEKNVQILGSFPRGFWPVLKNEKIWHDFIWRFLAFLGDFGPKRLKSFGKMPDFCYNFEIVFHESAFLSLKI